MHREEQLEHYLQQIVGEFFLKHVEFPAETLVTVTKAEISQDHLHGKVWVSVLPEQKAQLCAAIIRRNLYALQGEVNRLVQTRPVPRLSFKLDAGAAYSEHIAEVIKEIHE